MFVSLQGSDSSSLKKSPLVITHNYLTFSVFLFLFFTVRVLLTKPGIKGVKCKKKIYIFYYFL